MLVVRGLRLVEDPLLLVGEKLDDNEGEHELAEHVVVGGQGVSRNTRGKEEDVGWGCDDPQQDLRRKSAA